MKAFWDERYSSEDYIYGTEPNLFFKQEITKLEPGKILLPAEGEGRNAVFAAKLGWKVVAFDSSKEAIKKAMKLAKDEGVTFDYLESDLSKMNLSSNYFDCIGLIYVHLPPETRASIHSQLLEYLKPAGKLIVECFSKKQIKNLSGGPKSLEMLYSADLLESDFNKMNKVTITEESINLQEGRFHSGKADVIRLIATK
jgi:SAM-dependent methyltransferase